MSSYLALFALALQLVLTFGHVHLDGVGGNPAARVEMSGGGTPSSASKDTPDIAGDYCALCALIHLGGTLLLTQPPALSVPVAFGEWLAPTTADPISVISTPAAFAARAPPLS